MFGPIHKSHSFAHSSVTVATFTITLRFTTVAWPEFFKGGGGGMVTLCQKEGTPPDCHVNLHAVFYLM